MDFSLEWFNDNSGFVTFIAAMIALLIGVISACLSIWSIRITQRGLRLQYQPELVVETGRKEGFFFIRIENIGLGTAYQIKYNQDFIDFIREWTDQRVELTGHDLVDSLSLGKLKSGGFKEYTITPKSASEAPNEPIKLEIKIPYTDIFKKYDGKVDQICLIA
ncbi:MAG: hypothetical protein OXI43_12165 [Candidatus Poribacteria bacterium]|nr:hypothetical protein [Candidatus Poribacteria bacterium]